jgi:transmembrane protein TMEM260 (protein O-mannosyltransferase)
VKLLGWLAFIVPLGIYAASISPNVGAWDTGELDMVPYIFGIAHPTGFPAFILLGWLFSHALPLSTVAWRMSFLSAIAMAGTSFAVYALARLLGVARLAAFGAALLFALGRVAWTRGVRAEVHSLAGFEAVAATVLALLWYRTKDPRALVGACLAVGVGLATHEVVGLAVPGVAFLLIAANKMPAPRTIALCAACAVLPSVTYAYIPLRSAYVTAHRVDPLLALGVPPGRPYWDYGHPASARAFARYITGSDFHAPSSVAAIVQPATYARIWPRLYDLGVQEFPVSALVLALAGLTALAIAEPFVAAGLALALFPATIFAYSYYAESDPARYGLPTFAFVAALIAYGVTRIAGWLSHDDRRFANVTMVLALAILIVSLAYQNASIMGERADSRWADYVVRLRDSTPDNAIVVADWAYATPLAYAAFVERSMGNRVVETAHAEDDLANIRRWVDAHPLYVVSEQVPPMVGEFRLQLVSPGQPNILRVVPAH